MALPLGMMGGLMPGLASAATTIKATHGTGLCNLAFFLVEKQGLAQPDGVDLRFVVTPTNADIATLFGAGQVDMSVLPYSNFLTLYDAGAPVKIVAGAGVEGCILVAREGIQSAADLRGKTLGTFQADTLEVLPYDYLRKADMSFKDVKVRYFNTSPELAQAFINGAVDAMCHIEPYATRALEERKGSTVLSDGRDLYHNLYSDCVLAVRTPLLERNPQAVKAIIKAMFQAQASVENDVDAALRETVGSYYKTSFEAAKLAASKQPVMVDQRNNTQFILERGQSMRELGYVRKLASRDAIDWTLLEEVIAENPALYDSVKLKSA
ncbi:hypothetical protein GCM10025795_24640 [Verticiella sediminum]